MNFTTVDGTAVAGLDYVATSGTLTFGPGQTTLPITVQVLDTTSTFLLSGTGDLIEPDDGIVAIGSGGPFALAAAKALANNTDLSARAIAEKSMAIAGEICIYTNAVIEVEEL